MGTDWPWAMIQRSPCYHLPRRVHKDPLDTGLFGGFEQMVQPQNIRRHQVRFKGRIIRNRSQMNQDTQTLEGTLAILGRLQCSRNPVHLVGPRTAEAVET